MKTKVFKVLIAIVTIGLLAGIIAYIFPVFMELNTEEGRQIFKDRVDNSGFLGLLWLFAIQVAQIFLVFVPGEPVEILAGMCYGTFWGTLFIMISAAIISASIFFLVRKLGKKFVYNFCDKRKVKHIEEMKIFQNPKKIEKLLFVLFLIPGTPKDFLSYVSGLLPIKPINYIIISSLARFPSVISSTMIGDNIVDGNWKLGVSMYLVTFLLVGLVILIMNKWDKTNITKEAIETIKNNEI